MASQINKVWRFGALKPFMPAYNGRLKRAGIESVVKRPLFPGYVFIETKIDNVEFAISARSLIRLSDCALKLLRYGGLDNFQYAMAEDEREILMKLCGDDFCVEMSKGFIVGDHVEVRACLISVTTRPNSV